MTADLPPDPDGSERRGQVPTQVGAKPPQPSPPTGRSTLRFRPSPTSGGERLFSSTSGRGSAVGWIGSSLTNIPEWQELQLDVSESLGSEGPAFLSDRSGAPNLRSSHRHFHDGEGHATRRVVTECSRNRHVPTRRGVAWRNLPSRRRREVALSAPCTSVRTWCC